MEKGLERSEPAPLGPEEELAQQRRAALMAAVRSDPDRKWSALDLLEHVISHEESFSELGAHLDRLIADGELIQDKDNGWQIGLPQ